MLGLGYSIFVFLFSAEFHAESVICWLVKEPHIVAAVLKACSLFYLCRVFTKIICKLIALEILAFGSRVITKCWLRCRPC